MLLLCPSQLSPTWLRALCFPEAAQHQVKQLEGEQDHTQEASHQRYKLNFIVSLFRRVLVFPNLTLPSTFKITWKQKILPCWITFM